MKSFSVALFTILAVTFTLSFVPAEAGCKCKRVPKPELSEKPPEYYEDYLKEQQQVKTEEAQRQEVKRAQEGKNVKRTLFPSA